MNKDLLVTIKGIMKDLLPYNVGRIKQHDEKQELKEFLLATANLENNLNLLPHLCATSYGNDYDAYMNEYINPIKEKYEKEYKKAFQENYEYNLAQIIKDELELKIDLFKEIYCEDKIKYFNVCDILDYIKNENIVIFNNFKDWMNYISKKFFDPEEVIEYVIRANEEMEGNILELMDKEPTGSGLETLYITNDLIVCIYVNDVLFKE